MDARAVGRGEGAAASVARRRAAHRDAGSRQGRQGSGVKADRGWKRAFEDPISLPRGRQLITLKNAADYITRLPKAEHESPQWQVAVEALIMAAEGRGPLMHARIGMLRALNRHVERVLTLKKRRTQMYELRSGILHGSNLMLMDQDLAFGWDPRARRRTAFTRSFGVSRVSRFAIG